MSESAPLAKPRDPAEEVFKWIVSGASESEILESLAAHFPDQDARPLIVEAFGRLTKAGKVDGDTLRGFCVEATRTIYQRALEARDFSTALRAIQQLQRMPD